MEIKTDTLKEYQQRIDNLEWQVKIFKIAVKKLSEQKQCYKMQCEMLRRMIGGEQ